MNKVLKFRAAKLAAAGRAVSAAEAAIGKVLRAGGCETAVQIERVNAARRLYNDWLQLVWDGSERALKAASADNFAAIAVIAAAAERIYNAAPFSDNYDAAINDYMAARAAAEISHRAFLRIWARHNGYCSLVKLAPWGEI